MKKLISLLLALMMVLSLATVAFASEATPAVLDETKTNGKIDNSGSITINGVGVDATYSIYKLLHLESYDKDTKVYSYKVSAGWESFFATADAQKYFTIDASGYATWTAATDDATVATFAKLALAYAEGNGISPLKSTENASDYTLDGTTLKFSGLYLGYYLVDSTMGALCGLTTTNPHASINAKNKVPTIDKQVKEDSTSNWGNSNSADIGQIVEFRVTIDVHAGAQNYVFHDKMSDGLTYQGVSKVEHIIPGATEADTKVTTVDAAKYYTVKTTGLEHSDCDFEIVFNQDFCNHLKTNDKVVIYYSAMLNRNAVIAGTGNENEAYLEYGEDNETTSDKTQTYTYKFDLVKTDSQNTLIDGAAFKIYDAATGGTEVRVVELKDKDEKPVLDNNGNPIYRRARADETVGVNIVVNDGIATIVGLDNGTYYLEEVITPNGYNTLATRREFTISGANLDATFNYDDATKEDVYSTGSGVQVVNKAGNMLPETGATGTAMFIFFGMFVMLTTGVLLVTKKRMSMIEE